MHTALRSPSPLRSPVPPVVPNQLRHPIAYAPARSVDPDTVAHAVATLRTARTEGVLGDREAAALALIYRRYADMLRATANRILGTPADAEDIVHDLFCALPRLIAQYQGRGLGAWLRRAVVTRALMQLRRVRARREDQDLGQLHATAVLDGSLPDDSLARALATLAPSLRDVVTLRFSLGYSHQQIAGALCITPAASEVRLCRALKQLRAAIQPFC